ncbi:hypothetical protein NDU88_003001 [Pleurodeles waltl]|uniref:Uncharacterized protein n=1 Tax=Pleurodeles waltl TaxID=8319 RepID=A0AAV7RFD7_PLEWA|nr:hypothetical protein NDU88_003001 [Pleurodeles waltl]
MARVCSLEMRDAVEQENGSEYPDEEYLQLWSMHMATIRPSVLGEKSRIVTPGTHGAASGRGLPPAGNVSRKSRASRPAGTRSSTSGVGTKQQRQGPRQQRKAPPSASARRTRRGGSDGSEHALNPATADSGALLPESRAPR